MKGGKGDLITTQETKFKRLLTSLYLLVTNLKDKNDIKRVHVKQKDSTNNKWQSIFSF
jgi:hypothetical protein